MQCIVVGLQGFLIRGVSKILSQFILGLIVPCSLESGLSVVGVAGNAHESCESYNVALTKYRRAINRGEVKTLRG